MAKRLIIHAGLPKTGTSAIQVFLAKNRELLLEQGVDYYPLGEFEQGQKGAVTSGNGAYVSRAFLPPGHEAHLAESADVIEQFDAAVRASGSPLGIVSSEFFAVLGSAGMQRLHDHLSGLGVMANVVLFLRRQDDYLVSSYVQRVKRHQHEGSPEEFIQKNKDLPFLKYASYLRGLREIFGKNHVTPLLYEEAPTHAHGLVGQFLSGVGVDWKAAYTTPEQAVNVSPSAKEIKLMLALNKFKPRVALMDQLVELSAAAGRAKPHAQLDIVNHGLRREVLAHYEEENARVAREDFGRERLFPEPDGTEGSLHDVTLTAEDVVDILGGIIVRLDRRLGRVETQITQMRKERE